MEIDASLDTSVLLNFLKIKRIDLLQACGLRLHITDHVEKEIRECFPAQKELLYFGFEQKILQRIYTTTLEELGTFVQMQKERKLGAGECAAIAIAYHRQYYLVIDDKQAIKRVSSLIAARFILRTEDLLLKMVYDKILAIDEVLLLSEVWAKDHRFKLDLKKFQQIYL